MMIAKIMFSIDQIKLYFASYFDIIYKANYSLGNVCPPAFTDAFSGSGDNPIKCVSNHT